VKSNALFKLPSQRAEDKAVEEMKQQSEQTPAVHAGSTSSRNNQCSLSRKVICTIATQLHDEKRVFLAEFCQK
jgi:hypothetical protein